MNIPIVGKIISSIYKWATAKSDRGGSASFKGPKEVINIKEVQEIADRTLKDLLGLKPDATEQECAIADERFETALLGFSKDLKGLEKKIQEASRGLDELLRQPPLNTSTLREDEVIAIVEKMYKVALGLPEEATRDEIKQVISSLLGHNP